MYSQSMYQACEHVPVVHNMMESIVIMTTEIDCNPYATHVHYTLPHVHIINKKGTGAVRTMQYTMIETAHAYVQETIDA